MKYKPGTFITVPNIKFLDGKPPAYQALFLWLCRYADEDGICFPSREKLALNLDMDVRSITRYIARMVEDGIITKTKRRKTGDVKNNSNLYQIMLIDEQEDIFAKQRDKKCINQGDTDVPITKPINNQIHITKVEEDKSSLLPEVVYSSTGVLPPNRGKTRIQRVVSIYKDLFKHLYGVEPNLAMAPIGASIDKLSERYTELQIAALLISFFNWHGMDGNSEFDYNKLLSAAHPFKWFYNTINQYEIYLRNVYRLEFDSELLVRDFVGKSMLAIKDK